MKKITRDKIKPNTGEIIKHDGQTMRSRCQKSANGTQQEKPPTMDGKTDTQTTPKRGNAASDPGSDAKRKEPRPACSKASSKRTEGPQRDETTAGRTNTR